MGKISNFYVNILSKAPRTIVMQNYLNYFNVFANKSVIYALVVPFLILMKNQRNTLPKDFNTCSYVFFYRFIDSMGIVTKK